MQKGTGQKAMFLNLKEDGIKVRSATFKNKKAYNRKAKHAGNKGW